MCDGNEVGEAELLGFAKEASSALKQLENSTQVAYAGLKESTQTVYAGLEESAASAADEALMTR